MKNKKSFIYIFLTCVISVICVSLINAQEISLNNQGTMRAWGPEQATGQPNTFRSGDIQTAWASLTQDGQDEWLMLIYEKAVIPAQIRIFETFNPGAVVRVSIFTEDGREVTAWQGKDTVEANEGFGVAEIPLNVDVRTNRVKIYLDSTGVRGWNEIDAVELIGKDKTRQWASSASSSTTYAEQPRPVSPPPVMSKDEFSSFLNRSITVYIEGADPLYGVLERVGERFLVLRQEKSSYMYLVNKENIIYARVQMQTDVPQPAQSLLRIITDVNN